MGWHLTPRPPRCHCPALLVRHRSVSESIVISLRVHRCLARSEVPDVRYLTETPHSLPDGGFRGPCCWQGALRCHDPHGWIPHLHLNFYPRFQSVPGDPIPTGDPRFEREQRSWLPKLSGPPRPPSGRAQCPAR